jgi:cytochrome c biogenesis protein CcmG, thiol:disulfide interchange protein DsbE
VTRRRIAFAVAVLLVIGVLIGVEFLSGSSNTSEPGRPAPALPRAVLVPPPTTLVDLRGKPALINFWASWCDPCRKEAPELESFYRSHRGRVGMVGVDYNDDPNSGRDFVREFELTYPMLRDPNAVYGNRYGLVGLPTTVIIDSSGRIQASLRGPQTTETLSRALRGVR